MKIKEFKEEYLTMSREQQLSSIKRMEDSWDKVKVTKSAWILVQLIAWCQDNLK